jgi:hypothetical protein
VLGIQEVAILGWKHDGGCRSIYRPYEEGDVARMAMSVAAHLRHATRRR